MTRALHVEPEHLNGTSYCDVIEAQGPLKGLTEVEEGAATSPPASSPE
ncbi:hypothetical protein [Nocardia australiensis]|nr:hypothetical protein [Nocardia australiensis]